MNQQENQRSDQKFQLTIYFDGLCRVCSAEIDMYRKWPGAARINFVDITDTGFDPLSEGLDPIAVHKHMHARDQQGRLHVGVDAFVAIWQYFEKTRWLATLVSLPPIHLMARIGYEGFARIRKYLPKNPKKDCSQSPYCETHQSQR